MITNSFIRKVVINYLVYSHKYTLEKASMLYDYNEQDFEKVFNLLGEEFCVGVLNKIMENSGEDINKLL